MLDLVDIKREIGILNDRLGKTQEYLWRTWIDGEDSRFGASCRPAGVLGWPKWGAGGDAGAEWL